MDRGPRMAIIKVGRIFQRICSKIIDPSGAHSLKEDTAIALCLLQKEFPPSFFDPMTHLLVHFGRGVRHVWSRSLSMDVPYGTVYEGIKGFCKKQGADLREEWRRDMCSKKHWLFVQNTWWNFNPHDDEYGIIKKKIELQTRYQKEVGGLEGWKRIFKDGLTTTL